MHVHVVSSPYWPGPRGFSFGFLIGVLSTARWLKLLQRAKKGVETIHSAKFWPKGVQIGHSPHFAQILGAKLYKLFTDLKKGGQNREAYVVTFIEWVPPLLPGRLLDSKSFKATKLTIVTCSAIWYEVQQQCCRLTCNIWKRTHVLFVYLVMHTWLDRSVYMYIWLWIYERYLCIHARHLCIHL